MSTVHHASIERDPEDRARTTCSCTWASDWFEPTYRRGRSSEPPDPLSAKAAKVAWRQHVRDADTAEATPMAELLRRQTRSTMAAGVGPAGQSPPEAPAGRSPEERDQEALW